MTGNAVSLDKPIETSDGEAGTLGDIIPDEQSAEPFEQVLQQVADDHTRAVLMEALAKYILLHLIKSGVQKCTAFLAPL